MVADVAGLQTSNIQGGGVDLSLVTATFGPRYTFAHRRYAIFGQVLAGEANGFDSVFPTTNEWRTAPTAWRSKSEAEWTSVYRGTLRCEADWLRTQLPNGTTGVQNNLRIGAGLVFKF